MGVLRPAILALQKGKEASDKRLFHEKLHEATNEERPFGSGSAMKKQTRAQKRESDT